MLGQYPERIVTDAAEVGDQALLVTHMPASEDLEEVVPYTNVVIAAFTTCNARLRLNGHLQKLGDRVCYMDTGKNCC